MIDNCTRLSLSISGIAANNGAFRQNSEKKNLQLPPISISKHQVAKDNIERWNFWFGRCPGDPGRFRKKCDSDQESSNSNNSTVLDETNMFLKIKHIKTKSVPQKIIPRSEFTVEDSYQELQLSNAIFKDNDGTIMNDSFEMFFRSISNDFKTRSDERENPIIFTSTPKDKRKMNKMQREFMKIHELSASSGGYDQSISYSRFDPTAVNNGKNHSILPQKAKNQTNAQNKNENKAFQFLKNRTYQLPLPSKSYIWKPILPVGDIINRRENNQTSISALSMASTESSVSRSSNSKLGSVLVQKPPYKKKTTAKETDYIPFQINRLQPTTPPSSPSHFYSSLDGKPFSGLFNLNKVQPYA